jgi:hypothetical protein
MCNDNPEVELQDSKYTFARGALENWGDSGRLWACKIMGLRSQQARRKHGKND